MTGYVTFPEDSGVPLLPGRATIGTCSLCGGSVTQHSGAWYGVVPPTPTCSRCGAVPARRPGPVIPMEQPGQQITYL